MLQVNPSEALRWLQRIFCKKNSACFRNPGEQDGAVLPMGSSADVLATSNPDIEEEEEVDTPVYEKYDTLLHGNTRSRK